VKSLVVFLALAAAVALPAAHARTPPCPAGRYLTAAPLLAGVSGALAVEVGVSRTVAIDTACDPVRAVLKGTKRGTKVRAKWPACGSVRRVRLKAKIVDACGTMQGTIRGKRLLPARFSATLSRCGDGRFDERGEGCDAGAGCGAGQRCSTACTCEDIPFALALSPPSLTLLQGASGTVALNVTRQAGFDEPVTVTGTDLPGGVTFDPLVIPAGATTGTLTVRAAAGAAQGSSAPTVTGTAGGLVRTAALALLVRGPAGSLDTSFGTGGVVTTDFGLDDSAFAAAVQPDGKIVIAGYANLGLPASDDFALARYNADGTLDAGFGTGGVVTTGMGPGPDLAYALVLQPDGKIVVAGESFSGTDTDFALARYGADGTLDPSFGGDGKVTTDFGSDEVANAFALQPDGKIVVAGSRDAGPGRDFALARYDANGNLDPSFDGDGKLTTDFGADEAAIGLALQSGKLLVIGDSALVRYTATGAVDTSFGTGGKVDAAYFAQGGGIAVSGDGSIVVAGSADVGTDFDFAVARYRPDGTPDPGFGTGGVTTIGLAAADDFAFAVALQPDGKILVAGRTSLGFGDVLLVRLAADGTPDGGFGTGGITTAALGPGFDEGDALALASDGRIVVAGPGSTGDDDIGVARFWP
jgi:uncharacterized delta-60 repeat protein